MTTRRGRAGISALLLALGAGLLAGCGASSKVPQVVGLALDDAHNLLKDSGFEQFEDDDLFGDRAIMLDANWVVLEQKPAAGLEEDLDSTIELWVGKIEEKRAQALLADDSPVLLNLRASAAAEAEQKQMEAARKAAEEKRQAAEKAKQAESKRRAQGFISREQYGDDWPFTVPTAQLHCREPVGERFGKVTVTLAGDEYALNGSARGSKDGLFGAGKPDWLDIAGSPLWREEAPGIKVSTARAIDDGLNLCE